MDITFYLCMAVVIVLCINMIIDSYKVYKVDYKLEYRIFMDRYIILKKQSILNEKEKNELRILRRITMDLETLFN